MHVTHPRRPALLTAVAALAVAGPLICVPPASAAPPMAAEVSPHAAQTIDNIGASGAWWVNDLKNFDPKVQAGVGKLLFSKEGLDLSAYRYNIGGGGTAVTTPSRAPEDFLSDEGGYDWSRDKGGRTFLSYAAKYGVEDLIAFVNSAPAEWKTNGQSCGGYLKAEHEQDFARYIADVTDHFARKGQRFDYISPFNEPTNSFDSCGQEGMLVDVSQRDDIVRALGAEQRARGQRTGIIADESTSTVKFNDELPRWIAEPGTAQYVDRLAHHTYDNPSDANRAKVYETAKKAGIASWSTEICCFGKGGTGWAQEYDPGIDGGLNLSRIVHKDFTVAHDSAFHWWVALSEMIGTDPYAKNDAGWNDGLIYYDPDYATNGNQTLYFTKRYYALGQYSKFVRSGSALHNVTGVLDGVEVSAYDHNGKWVVVVNNHNTTASSLDLHFNGKAPVRATQAVRTSATENWARVDKPSVKRGTLSASLPARSITTYVLDQKGKGGSALTGAWQGAQSGKCLAPDVTIRACTDAVEQEWSYDARGALRSADGYLTAGSSGLTVSSGFTGDAAQRWLLNGNGQIVSEATGQCLDVAGQATADGSRVGLWTCNGGTNQAWFRQ
ncbi:glycoside hydrolase [Streptomyces sp. NPDC054829]